MSPDLVPDESPSNISRDLELQQRDWDSLARLDPFWAVLTTPEGRHGGWSASAFFETGEKEVAHALRTASEHGARHGAGRALDFGCGIGRTTRALSTRFREVHGVDISPEMISLARRFNADRPNCAFRLNSSPDLPEFQRGTYDFVYSNIVLQHLPHGRLVPPYLTSLISLLATDGLLVFQLPYRLSVRRRLQPRRRLYGVLRRAGCSETFLYRRVGLNPMRTVFLPRTDVEAAIAAADGDLMHAQPANEAPNPSWFYYVRRPHESGPDPSSSSALRSAGTSAPGLSQRRLL